MNFGVFLAPFHKPDDDPTLALERDLELIAHLDALGFDEAWVGEHHSGGSETIASPEVFIAAAAARTSRIRLGTGVSSLPYHHPLLLADRMVLLDHLTRGRTMFGVGPGALVSDAHMLGIDPLRQRDMMEESLDAILALLDGSAPVTRETSWFTLHDARLQLRPFSRPRFEIAVAAMVSPSGPRLAARYGLSLLSVAATTMEGFSALGSHWTVMEEHAARSGTVVERSRWRLVAPVYVAETMEQVRADVRFGIQEWLHYFTHVAALPLLPPGLEIDDTDMLIDLFNASGLAVVGTPDMAVDMIAKLQAQSGGFGTFLIMAHEWARRDAILRSYELFARHVIPAVNGTTAPLLASRDVVAASHVQSTGEVTAAIEDATKKYIAERDALHPNG
jgi:limonene 1,2-monooxygenase